MSDHADETEHDESEEPQREWEERRTAPQSDYSLGQVGLGAVVALVGLLVTFGVPLLLA